MFSGVSPRRVVCDVRLLDGMVAEIGVGLAADECTVIDADGMWVMPGFIDAHSHADAAAMMGDGMETRALAGVTTEIVGQDGLGLSSAAGAARAIMEDTLGALLGDLPAAEFADIASYLDAIDTGSYARVATLVPHGAIRATVMGRNLREANLTERQIMSRLIHDGLQQGAVGISTGLTYPPALAATTDELVDVTSGLATGTPYVTHLRDYGLRLDMAVSEALEICKQGSLSLHLSHFHVSGSGRDGQATGYLQRFRASAQKVTWDTYPYTAGCTFVGALLPESVQGVSIGDLRTALLNPAEAARVAAEITLNCPRPTFAGGWDVITLAGLAHTRLRDWDSRSIANVAAATGSTTGAVVLRVVSETNGQACVVVDHGHLNNVRELAATDGHHVGSDGILGSGVPHPRAGNTFFRFLDWANRGRLDASVEEMVSRMTARTAGRFGLHTGRLESGWPADVLIVNPAAIEEGPNLGQYVPRALVHSFIRGERVVRDGLWRGSKLKGLAMRKVGNRW